MAKNGIKRGRIMKNKASFLALSFLCILIGLGYIAAATYGQDGYSEGDYGIEKTVTESTELGDSGGGGVSREYMKKTFEKPSETKDIKEQNSDSDNNKISQSGQDKKIGGQEGDAQKQASVENGLDGSTEQQEQIQKDNAFSILTGMTILQGDTAKRVFEIGLLSIGLLLVIVIKIVMTLKKSRKEKKAHKKRRT